MDEIVIYFSRADENYAVGYIEKGNTEKVAEYISKYKNIPLFKIEPVNAYPVTYDKCIKKAKEEQTANERPPIKSFLEDLDKYDTIYLGYPNWWDDAPMCVYTFLDNYDLKNKIIKPFCTHEGSAMGNTEKKLQAEYKEAVFTAGLAIQGCMVDEEDSILKIEAWLD